MEGTRETPNEMVTLIDELIAIVENDITKKG